VLKFPQSLLLLRNVVRLAYALVALAAPLFLGERLERRTIIAAGVSLFGLTLLLEPWRSALSRGDLTGACLGALSALFYASNVIANKRLGAQFSPAQILFFHGLVAAPLLYLRTPSGALTGSPDGSRIAKRGRVAPGRRIGRPLPVWAPSHPCQ
jgi:drug/metabolite transporter (DMT)-like permease